MLFTLKNSRTTKQFSKNRDCFHIGFGSSPGGAVPDTILEIYGEYWDGINMNPPYIGNPLTLVLALSPMAAVPPLNKMTIGNTQNGAHLYSDLSLNSNNDNYVVFSVTRYVTGIATGQLCSFRNLGVADHLYLETRNGGGDSWNGYCYGNPGIICDFVDLAPFEDTTAYKIRCWIFQELRGDLYLNGGASVFNFTWVPTSLGGLPNEQLFFKLNAAGQNVQIAHFSIHKFPPGDTVKLSWVNDYGNALNVYYDSLSWTDIA